MVQQAQHPLPSLHVETFGSGPPCVLLHGWGLQGSDLRAFADLLASDYEVHLVDLPGFGKSGAPPTPWGAEEYADCIAGYIRNNKLKPVRLIGHSFGGKISAVLAACYPALVASLVLVNSSGLKRERPMKERARLHGIRFLGRSLRFFSSPLFERWFVPMFGSPDYKRAGLLRPILVKAVNEEIKTHLKAIKVPTMLLWGSEDEETPQEIALRMKGLIPHARLTLLPGKGHNMLEGSSAHLCLYHLEPFLKSEECS